jgi:hypothetical protein
MELLRYRRNGTYVSSSDCGTVFFNSENNGIQHLRPAQRKINEAVQLFENMFAFFYLFSYQDRNKYIILVESSIIAQSLSPVRHFECFTAESNIHLLRPLQLVKSTAERKH